MSEEPWEVNDEGRPIALPASDPYAWACVWDGKRWAHVLRIDITIIRSKPEEPKAKRLVQADHPHDAGEEI